MGHREDYQIPDWVVKDYNSRVPKEDRLPLYDGTDSFSYDYPSTGSSSHEKIMIALNKALRTGDFKEYDRLKLEERMLWYGARGFTKEQVLEMFYNKEESSQDKNLQPSKTFDYFMLLLLMSAIALMIYMISTML